jgi:hypothetical protein
LRSSYDVPTDKLTISQTTIEDLIEIKPQDFDKPSKQAIKDAINTKYSNKIIQKIGLCLCLWDLLETSEGLIGHGTGLVYVNGRRNISLTSSASILLSLGIEFTFL